MKIQLANDLLNFLWRVRCGHKNDKQMRSDALVLALRVTELQNTSPDTVEKIVKQVMRQHPDSLSGVTPFFHGRRKLALPPPEKKKSPPRHKARAGVPETVNRQQAG